eukprot:316712_1
METRPQSRDQRTLIGRERELRWRQLRLQQQIMGLSEPIRLTSSRNVGGMGVDGQLMSGHMTPSPMRRQLTRSDGFFVDDTPMGQYPPIVREGSAPEVDCDHATYGIEEYMALKTEVSGHDHMLKSVRDMLMKEMLQNLRNVAKQVEKDDWMYSPQGEAFNPSELHLPLEEGRRRATRAPYCL